ncbi:MAG: cysteine desulfurase [Bacteroidales bacterium]|nr:cysteine desulfurase [Bacteroidales bacterium]
MSFNIDKIRKDFPILNQKIYGKPLIYLDNAATTQKPQVVIDKISELYSKKNSNIHRGVHFLSNVATEEYENSRKIIRKFINAKSTNEIIFTKGTTDAINLIVSSFGEKYIKSGDEIIVTEMEHHSNLVPWQMLCERKNAKLKFIPLADNGELKIDELEKLISPKTKLIAFVHISNSLGTINPVKKIIEKAHKYNIPVLIDGAQAIQHKKTDVRELDCDFYVFSGHKMYGPNGVGVLYGKEEWLEKLPPYQYGGEMVKTVSIKKTYFNELPFKFEAGTPNYIDATALGTAIEYIENIGFEQIKKHEHELLKYATEKLTQIKGIKFYGESPDKSSVVSFLLKGIHHYDTGMILDKLGIAVRTGTHCSEPAMKRFNIDGTVRASFAMYNKKEEIDSLFDGLQKVIQMFS